MRINCPRIRRQAIRPTVCERIFQHHLHCGGLCVDGTETHTMHVAQLTYSSSGPWQIRSGDLADREVQLVLTFGDRHFLATGAGLEELRQRFPRARIVIASSSGEILGTELCDQSLCATAIAFERTQLRCSSIDVADATQSYEAGRHLAQDLSGDDLAHVFVVSNGHSVNGAELARGFSDHLPANVRVTGGMAGDGARFELTLVGLDAAPTPYQVVAVGFYGSHLEVGYGCAGGWEAFGPERRVTRSQHNILHELDGESALQLYKRYLGDEAAKLPGSALHFPLGVLEPGATEPVVRTILSIDEATGSMVFAGDIPQGSKAWLMRASYDDLIDGAESAAAQCRNAAPPELAICVSCVGRRLVLGQRTEEETDGVRNALGATTVITGFYSYGELAPHGGPGACRLHNETMTITTLREV